MRNLSVGPVLHILKFIVTFSRLRVMLACRHAFVKLTDKTILSLRCITIRYTECLLQLIISLDIRLNMTFIIIKIKDTNTHIILNKKKSSCYTLFSQHFNFSMHSYVRGSIIVFSAIQLHVHELQRQQWSLDGATLRSGFNNWQRRIQEWHQAISNLL